MSSPRVSVLMAVYNDERYVASSVQSILDQTFTDFEFVIVNDASTDRSREIIASFGDPRIHIIDNEQNLRLTRSLNRGLAAARGEYVARFDSNDLSLPERLAKQVAFLDAHPEVAVLGTQMTWIDTAGRKLSHPETRRLTTRDGVDWYAMFDSPVAHSATMYRRSVIWDELHGYDPVYTVGEDADLWQRVGERHRIANLPDMLFICRIDPASISGDMNLPVRAGHFERWRVVCQKSMAHILGPEHTEQWSAEWVALNDPRARITADHMAAFLRSVTEMRARFNALRPGAARNEEINWFCAVLVSRALFRVLNGDGPRRGSVAAYLRVLRTHLRYGLQILPKFAALFMLGGTATRLWRRLRRPSA